MLGGWVPPAIAVADADCTNAEVVFARGTNEPPGVGEIGQAFVDAVTARLPGKTISVSGVEYPASYDFSDGVLGVINAADQLETIANTCPKTKVIFGGYSQGAAVAGYTLTDSFPPGFVFPPGIPGPLPASIGSHIAAVVMFGTPKPDVVRLLASAAPPMSIAASYGPKTLQLCAPLDPVCDSGLDRAAHHAYLTNGMIDQAADFAAHAVLGR